MVTILGIETSCDETGIAIVEDGCKILSEKLKSSVDLQAEYGGVVPELASRVHVENINVLIKKALDEAKLRIEDVDAIAVANGPGLNGALLVGTMVAKTIALVEKKKIVSVNHLEGHIFSSFLPKGKNEENIKYQISNIKHKADKKMSYFPMMVLIVSGGHTEIVLMEDYGIYKTIGSTVDDAAGEAFDKAAKILGLPYPGGPSIARSAMQISNLKSQISNKSQNVNVKLPRPMMNSGDYNFSFSGLKTALLYEVQKVKSKKLKVKNANKKLINHKISNSENILNNQLVSMSAWEFQEAVVEVLVAKTKKAMQDMGVYRLAVVGGVAANQRLREKIYEEIDGEIMIPEFKYCTDNGVKIAVAGYYKYMSKEFVRWQDLEVRSNWEL